MKAFIANIARLFARSLAVLFAFVFFLTAVAWLLAFSLERQVFNPSIYKHLLAQRQMYSRLPELVAEQLTFTLAPQECLEGEPCENRIEVGPKGQLRGASPELLACLKQSLSQAEFAEVESGSRPLVDNRAAAYAAKPCLKQFGLPENTHVNLGGMPVYLWMLEAADWQLILAELLPADWAQKSVESAIDQAFASLEAPKHNPAPIRISLIEFKERLNGEPGRRVLAQVFSAQPPCPRGSPGIPFELPGSGREEGPTELCRPENDYLEETIAQSRIALAAASNEIPDEATLTLPGLEANSPPGSGPNLAELAAVRRMLPLSLVLPIFFLGLVALFGARSWRGLFTWWGLPILAAGGLVLAVGLVTPPLVVGKVIPMITDRMSGSPLTPALQSEVLGLAQAAIGRIAHGILIVGSTIGGIGLVLLIGAFLFKEKSSHMPQVAQVEQGQQA